jgi:hypothetical protein
MLPRNFLAATAALGVLCLALTGLARGQEVGPRVTFKLLDGEETGLTAILADWKASELKRQGKFGEHGWWLWGLVPFDYDNDGCLDLLVLHHGNPGSMLLRNLFKDKGKVTFVNVTGELGVARWKFLVGSRPKIWDVDGDGWPDVVGIGPQANTCFWNREGKRLVPMNIGFDPQGIAEPIDFNGDGYLDTYSLRGARRYLYTPATHTFRSSPYLPPLYAAPPASVANLMRGFRFRDSVRFFEGVDLNGDGIPDLVVAGFGTHGGPTWGRYLLGDGRGQFVDQTEALGLPREGTPILVRDLTGSGAPDILVACGTASGLYVNDGKGKFTRRQGELTDFLGKRAPHLHEAFVADFNNDGLLDLVVNRPRGGRVEAFQNLGGGNFVRVAQVTTWDGDPVAIGDFNNDGLLDLAVGGPDDTVTFLLNQTPRPGNYCNLFPRLPSPNPLAVGARLEVFRAGDLGKDESRPLLIENAHCDGSPVHVGLGSASRFDLRVVFPGKGGQLIEHRNVLAKPKLKITPDTKPEEF